MSEHDHEEMAFRIQRIYIKDISFETPSGSNIFQKEWCPTFTLDLDTSYSKLENHVYEVILRVIVTANIAAETAFLCEVQQAGIFYITGIEERKMAHCLGAYCPNTLFPYARECITNLVSRGTFPQLNLAPINFDELFVKHLQQQNSSKPKKSTNHQEFS